MGHAADVVGFALFGGVVAGWKVAEGWPGSEEGEEVRGEFVRHCDRMSGRLFWVERKALCDAVILQRESSLCGEVKSRSCR